MWSTSAGSEVMKPLATPVLGGMVSSLLHVLIVTPVIFFWLRERQLKKHSDDMGDEFSNKTIGRASDEGRSLQSVHEKESGTDE
jgi:hypothetical protein